MNTKEDMIEKIITVLRTKKLRKILVRIDEVYVHQRVESLRTRYIRGCVLVVEQLAERERERERERESESGEGKRNPKPVMKKYVVWVPYSLLMKVDSSLCVYLKKNGSLVTQKEFEKDENIEEITVKMQEDKYVTAEIKEDKGKQTQEVGEVRRSLFGLEEMYSLCVEFGDINSLQKNIPTQGWASLIIILNNLEKSEILFFHDGGLNDFISELNTLVTMNKVRGTPNVYVLNDPTENPLKRGLKIQGLNNYLISFSGKITKQMKESQEKVKVKKVEVLKNMKLYDEKGKNKFESEKKQKFSGGDKQVEVKTDENDFFLFLDDDSEDEKNDGGTKKLTDFDIIINAKWKDHDERTVTKETFLGKYFDEKSGKVKNLKKLRSDIFYGGITFSKEVIENDLEEKEKDFSMDELIGSSLEGVKAMPLRRFLWLHLLEFFSFEKSTYATRKEDYLKMKKDYFTIKNQWLTMTNEQIKNNSEFRNRINKIEKDVVRTDRTYKDYINLEGRGIKKLKEILITYTFYNFDIGYCQGMNDLLSPILTVVRDEAVAFWCFTNLMRKVGNNFSKSFNQMDINLSNLLHIVKVLDYRFYSYLFDISAENLFFCFRWILVLFKREFTFLDTIRLWDRVFTHHLDKKLNTNNFKEVLFIAYAILHNEKDEIMKEGLIVDQIFKYCIDLSHKIDYIDVLKTAQASIWKYRSAILKQKSNM